MFAVVAISSFGEIFKVDISNGVSKKEAVTIAQDYVILKGLDKLLNIKKWKIESIPKDDENWTITFFTRFIAKIKQGLLCGYVYVNKKIEVSYEKNINFIIVHFVNRMRHWHWYF